MTDSPVRLLPLLLRPHWAVAACLGIPWVSEDGRWRVGLPLTGRWESKILEANKPVLGTMPGHPMGHHICLPRSGQGDRRASEYIQPGPCGSPPAQIHSPTLNHGGLPHPHPICSPHHAKVSLPYVLQWPPVGTEGGEHSPAGPR